MPQKPESDIKTFFAEEETRLLAKPQPWLARKLGIENYRILRGLYTNPLSVTGMVIILFFVFIAAFAPVLAPPIRKDHPYMIPRDGFSPEPRPPMSEWHSHFHPPLPFWWEPVMGTKKWKHLMGTASGQWDIYYGIVWGTRTAFKVGIIITFSVVLIGIIIGSLSGFYGGAVDNVLMRITDIFMTFPFLVAALTFSAIITPKVGKGIVPAMIALTTFGWMGYARLIRGDVLSVKGRDYVLAAQVIGASDFRIITRHILPNAIYPTLVVASMDVGSYVLSFAALSFLGVGVEVGYADWGQLISFARDWIAQIGTYWYMVAFPGIALVLFVLGWNLIGDAVRDVMDPRLRGER